jgi:hypothetical protein
MVLQMKPWEQMAQATLSGEHMISADKYIRVTGVDTFDLRTYANVRSDIGAAVSGANSDITSMSGITGTIATPTNLSGKTTGAWSKTIGSGGDYADWATMIVDMPDLIAHAITVTIKAGTTLTEICELKNKHGITAIGEITIQAEKYYPTASVIPTADSATATTLRDAELATAALGNDYFNGCWIQIVDGTGTDNGFVLITDYVDATGDVVVASWPGTQPDNTSRYIIVGALINCGGSRAYGFTLTTVFPITYFYGIGIKDADLFGAYMLGCQRVSFYYCGAYNCDRGGFVFNYTQYGYVRRSGIVKCNTDNASADGGIEALIESYIQVRECGISDNLQRGIHGRYSSIIYSLNNFGDANGAWGLYVTLSAQASVVGLECSGATGNHSDPGTAGDDAADQAAAY